MSQSTARRNRTRAETPPEPEPEPNPEAEPDTEPPAEPEPEPEADPAEVQARKIDNARRKYHKDLTGIIGDLGPVSECPYCDGLGLVPDEAAFLKRDDVDACPKCHGLGQMFTGSQVREHSLLPCPDCAGTGYRNKPPENVHALPTPAPPPQPAAAQVHGWFDPVTQTFHPYATPAEQS